MKGCETLSSDASPSLDASLLLIPLSRIPACGRAPHPSIPMTRFSRLTADAVRAAAILDASTTGTTTTLDVKRELRDRGYWAVQSDVSFLMEQIASASGWPWWDLGGFRLYAVPRGGGRGAGLAARKAMAN